ncbi:MAG: hypothetical protein MJ094_00120 [Saccharofermentans sp.]|nr:hypothetical protein [Saccharofermentans sp.]
MAAISIVYDADNYGTEVLASMILAFYEVGALLVTAVTAIFTTCDYSKYRLAINIEGVERNKFKLRLSEVVGILIFVAVICLLGVPFAVIGSFLSGNGTVLSLQGWIEIIKGFFDVALVFFITSAIVCITGYFVSNLTKAKMAAFIIVALLVFAYLIFLVTAVGFIKGFNEATDAPTNIGILVSIVLVVLAIIPGILSGTIFAIKDRRRDRI